MNAENLREMEDCLLYIVEMGLIVLLFLAAVGIIGFCVYELVSSILERREK